jgi:uncharacterized protein (TIGR02246 family)
MRTSALLFAALLSIAACQPRAEPAGGDSAAVATNDASVRKSIEEANSRFLAALEKADTATMMANYADDAVVMPPGGPTMKGRVAIGQGFSGMLSQAMIMSPKLFTDDVIVRDDIAIESGRYDWMVHPKTGAAVTEKGKYITIWRRQADGSWKIIKDINNSDAPAK